MTCVQCGKIDVIIAQSKKTFCSYECMIENEGKDYLEIKQCMIHDECYKGECEKCINDKEQKDDQLEIFKHTK